MLIQRTQRVQAANIRHKLAERHGAVVTIDGVDHLTAIPPDEMVAIREVWGVPAVKVPWLRAVGRAELEGDLDAESLRAMDPAEALARLREIDGIGPFGAELILVRGAAAPDVFARNEPLLHRVITHHYGLADPAGPISSPSPNAGDPAGPGPPSCSARPHPAEGLDALEAAPGIEPGYGALQVVRSGSPWTSANRTPGQRGGADVGGPQRTSPLVGWMWDDIADHRRSRPVP